MPEVDSGIKSTGSKDSFRIVSSIKKRIGPASGWHGWKLHRVCAVAAVWIPLAAVLTAANRPDSDLAPLLLVELPAEVRYFLADRHYNRDELRALCAQDGRCLVTTRYGCYPHTDDGVVVRRTFHKLRSVAIENLNEHLKGIFDGHGQVPTKGLLATSALQMARGLRLSISPIEPL